MRRAWQLWTDGSNALYRNDFRRAEQLSLEALQAHDCDPNDRHFAYNTLIELYYKQRDKRNDAIEKCIRYCKEDIDHLDEFIRFSLRDCPVIPAIPSIKRLAIIEEKAGRIDEAIKLCEISISKGIEYCETKGGYAARLEKLKRKSRRTRSFLGGATMKDKLLCLVIGLLLGIVVTQWTTSADMRVLPTTARAETVDPTADIVALTGNAALDRSGHVWSIVGAQCWQQCPFWDPPLPVTNIRLWETGQLVANNGDLWSIDSSGQWHNCGPWPGSPVDTGKHSWGSVKGKFNPEEKR